MQEYFFIFLEDVVLLKWFMVSTQQLYSTTKYNKEKTSSQNAPKCECITSLLFRTHCFLRKYPTEYKGLGMAVLICSVFLQLPNNFKEHITGLSTEEIT